MRNTKRVLWALELLALAVALPVGCNDVGDNTGTMAANDGGVDATASGEGGDDGAATADSPADTSSPVDATQDSVQGSGEDTGAPEAGPEAEAPETGGEPEAEAPETGAEAEAPETGVEAAAPEAGPPEAGTPEAGPDTGSETGTPDAGSETGGGNTMTACTTTPCAASGSNSVQCPGTTNDGVCTATEAAIVARDIAQGNLVAGQLAPFTSTLTTADQGSCYACLNYKSCLDDNNGDTGNECADAPDLTGQGGGTAGATGQGPALCTAVLDCILSSDCQGAGGIAGTSATVAQENANLCYCGGNNAGSVCSAAGTVQNGPCVTQEAAGSGFAQSDSKDILANFGSNLYPYGIANHIFQCARSQKCTICE
jgi:hypothetical protein